MPPYFFHGKTSNWNVPEIAIFLQHKALLLRLRLADAIKSQTIEGLYSSRALELYKKKSLVPLCGRR